MEGAALLITNRYPSYENLYQNGFIASRIRNYQQEGTRVVVFCLNPGIQELEFREFEGTQVLTGPQEVLEKLVSQSEYGNILVHFLSPEMKEVLDKAPSNKKIIVWIHGFEAQPWWRRAILYTDVVSVEKAKKQSEIRMAFWERVISTCPSNWHFVFVSQWLAKTFFFDIGLNLERAKYSVIHNLVDTEKYIYRPKGIEQRFKVLSIRPFASKIYANDLSVAAVKWLSENYDDFDKFEFSFYGDGPLFDETVEPILNLDNVQVFRKFLSQSDIARIHAEYGVFLVPSRMDTQGVSRGEAMSSGLVPVTTDAAAIPEFVDTKSGLMVEQENPIALAKALIKLAEDPGLFSELSRGAANRVREQLSATETTLQEISLIEESI